MTLEEKTYKIAKASKDLTILNSLLDMRELNREGATIQKIMATPDYQKYIIASRVVFKIPIGTTPFGNLEYVAQRKVVKMLISAVETYLVDLQKELTE